MILIVESLLVIDHIRAWPNDSTAILTHHPRRPVTLIWWSVITNSKLSGLRRLASQTAVATRRIKLLSQRRVTLNLQKSGMSLWLLYNRVRLAHSWCAERFLMNWSPHHKARTIPNAWFGQPLHYFTDDNSWRACGWANLYMSCDSVAGRGPFLIKKMTTTSLHSKMNWKSRMNDTLTKRRYKVVKLQRFWVRIKIHFYFRFFFFHFSFFYLFIYFLGCILFRFGDSKSFCISPARRQNNDGWSKWCWQSIFYEYLPRL